MSRLLTVLMCIIIAAAAAFVIYAMFRPEGPVPAASTQPGSTPTSAVREPTHSLYPSITESTSRMAKIPVAAASNSQAPHASSAPVTPVKAPAKPLQHVAALSANDRALRDRATQLLIDQAMADPDARDKLLEELHAAFDSANANGKLRIMYIAANINGKARINVDDPKAPAALLAGLHYLETHLNDPAISDFAPHESFTHLALSKGSDGQWVWLLDDITSSRGINLYFDPTGTRIIRASTWPQPK